MLHNDEGMWLLNNLPEKRLKSVYGFVPSVKWRERVMKSSVRLNFATGGGGSGSFVSSRGLLATNHHIARDMLQKLSSQGKNYVRDGFYAASHDKELRAHDCEVNVLMETHDVTDRVVGALKPSMSYQESFVARRAVIAAIERESDKRTGLRSDVITLYQGGAYHLYCYKRYTDIRVVFAPELAVSFLGGDVDNFEFPRYALDVTFLRAYENGKPVHTPHRFQWSKSGPEEEMLLFVSGHPGITQRLYTVAHLKYLRDVELPHALILLRRKEALLDHFSQKGDEYRRQAWEEKLSLENKRKLFNGRLQALYELSLFSRKEREEYKMKSAITKDREMSEEYEDALDAIASSCKSMDAIRDGFSLLELAEAFDSELFWIARATIRHSEETAKPDEKRLEEYRESKRKQWERRLFSDAPIYKEFESYKLADSLSLLAERYGADHFLVRMVLAGKSPKARAHELVFGTSLDQVSERKRLVGLSQNSIFESGDPLIVLALLVDSYARDVRKKFENDIKEVRTRAYEKITRVWFKLHGASVYPDGTFSLRLAFGLMKGFTEIDGSAVRPYTTLGGLYEYAWAHGNKGLWKLPKRWLALQKKLEKSATSFNFISTLDTIGGNSGSPVFTKDCEIVGLHFDGNAHKMMFAFGYDDERARSIGVSSAAILEALQKVYHADKLIKELLE